MIENVVNENNEEVKIDIILSFDIEEYNKKFVAYTVNDDGVSETAQILINEYVIEDGIPHIKPIPDDEAQTVLGFYNHLRENL